MTLRYKATLGSRPSRRRFGASCASGLAGLLWIFCPIGVAQQSPLMLQVDPFIAAIEEMKYALAPVDCLAANGAESKVLERMGTAFLVSGAGDFLTAAHVVREMQKVERECPTTVITLPGRDWRPEAPTEQMRWFPFFSGSPVYLADGKVVAILVANGKSEATGITVARPASMWREMLAERPSK
jgi:hypothetical protein